MNLSPILLVSLGLLAICFLVQLFYYLYFYLQPLSRINAEKKHQIHYTSESPGVSVVIYSNNDSEQLRKNLTSILEQDYPSFEVIVVNDGSSDETEEVLTKFENQYPQLYHTFLSGEARNLSRRKLSLTLGIKAARHEIILFTNANCQPQSNQWIQHIARNFTAKTDIVLGYTRFEKRKGFGERFIAFDLLLRSLRQWGYTLALSPYCGEGSNMAYRKHIFFENKGFAKYMHLHLGDDDLFINQVSNRRNTKIELSPEASIIANYQKNKEGWLYLKRSYAFTSRFYKTAAMQVFGAESFSRYLFYTSAVIAIILSRHQWTPLITVGFLVGLKVILQGFFWYQAGKKLQTRRFIFCIPLFELIDPIINFFIKINALIHRKKNYTWRL